MAENNIFENEIVKKFNDRIDEIKLKYMKLNKKALEDYNKKLDKINNDYDEIYNIINNDYLEKIKYLEKMDKMAEEMKPITEKNYNNKSKELVSNFEKELENINKEIEKLTDKKAKDLEEEKSYELNKFKEAFEREVENINKNIKDLSNEKESKIKVIVSETNLIQDEIKSQNKKQVELLKLKYDGIRKETKKNYDNKISEIEDNYKESKSKFEKYKKNFSNNNEIEIENELTDLKNLISKEVESKNKIKLEEVKNLKSNEEKIYKDKLNKYSSDLKILDEIWKKEKYNLSNELSSLNNIEDIIKKLDDDIKNFKNNNSDYNEFKEDINELESIKIAKEKEIRETSEDEVSKFISESMNMILKKKKEDTEDLSFKLNEVNYLLEVFNRKLKIKSDEIDNEIKECIENKDKLKNKIVSLNENLKLLESNKDLSNYKKSEYDNLMKENLKEKEQKINKLNINFESYIKKLNEENNLSKKKIESDKNKLIEINNLTADNIKKIKEDINKLETEFKEIILKNKEIDNNTKKEIRERLALEKDKELKVLEDVTSDALKKTIFKENEMYKEKQIKILKEKYNEDIKKIEVFKFVNENDITRLSSKNNELREDNAKLQSVITQNQNIIDDFKLNFDKKIEIERKKNSDAYQTEKYIIEKESEQRKKEEIIEIQNLNKEISNLEKEKLDLQVLLSNGQLNDQGIQYIVFQVSVVEEKIKKIQDDIKLKSNNKSIDLSLTDSLKELNDKYIRLDSELEISMNQKITNLENKNKELKEKLEENKFKISKNEESIKVIMNDSNKLKLDMINGITKEYDQNVENISKDIDEIYKNKLKEEINKSKKILDEKYEKLQVEEESKFSDNQLKVKEKEYNMKIFNSTKLLDSNKTLIEANINKIKDLDDSVNNINNEYLKNKTKFINNLKNESQQIEIFYKAKEDNLSKEINKLFTKDGINQYKKEINYEIENIEQNLLNLSSSKNEVDEEKNNNTILYQKNKITEEINKLDEKFVKDLNEIKNSKDSLINNRIKIETDQLEKFIKENKSNIRKEYSTSLDNLSDKQAIYNKFVNYSQGISKVNLNIKDLNQNFITNQTIYEDKINQINLEINKQIEETFKTKKIEVEEKYESQIEFEDFNDLINEINKSRINKINEQNKMLSINNNEIDFNEEKEISKENDNKNNKLIQINSNLSNELIKIENDYKSKSNDLINKKSNQIKQFSEIDKTLTQQNYNTLSEYVFLLNKNNEGKKKSLALKQKNDMDKIKEEYDENMKKYNVNYKLKISEEEKKNKEKIRSLEENLKTNISDIESNYKKFKNEYFNNFKDEMKLEEMNFMNQI